MQLVYKKDLDNDFFKNFFKIALPVTFQNFIAASLNLVDNIMVGKLGDSSIAAVGVGNQIYFLLQLFLLGTSGGASIFASQYWGKKDIKGIKRVLGFSLIVSSLASLIFSILAFFLPTQMLSLFSNDNEVIMLGSSYLRNVCPSYIIVAVTSCYIACLRSTKQVKMPMIANFTALVFNTFLNYLLIFGNFGMPQLGVKGAAIATTISRVIDVIIIFIWFYGYKNVLVAKLNELIDFNIGLIKRFAKTFGTLIIKDMIWAFGMSLYMIIYGKLGTEELASINIVNTINQLAFVFFIGVANAALVLIGNKIGENEYKLADNYSHFFLNTTILLGLLLGIFIISIKNIILIPFNVSEEVVSQVSLLLVIYGFIFFIKAYNMVAVVGILRSGGDTMFCLIMDLIAVWVIGVPLAIYTGTVLMQPIHYVFIAINSQEIFKMIVIHIRLNSKKWINSLVSDI